MHRFQKAVSFYTPLDGSWQFTKCSISGLSIPPAIRQAPSTACNSVIPSCLACFWIIRERRCYLLFKSSHCLSPVFPLLTPRVKPREEQWGKMTCFGQRVEFSKFSSQLFSLVFSDNVICYYFFLNQSMGLWKNLVAKFLKFGVCNYIFCGSQTYCWPLGPEVTTRGRDCGVRSWAGSYVPSHEADPSEYRQRGYN